MLKRIMWLVVPALLMLLVAWATRFAIQSTDGPHRDPVTRYRPHQQV